MTLPADQAAARWRDAELLAAVVAVAPSASGGAVVRAAAGPVRDLWLQRLCDLLGEDYTSIRKLPIGAGEERVFGGLDIAATLSAGRSVVRPGLIETARGGVLIIAMSDRVPVELAARLAAEIDDAEDAPALIALDEGDGSEEATPRILQERLGARISLDAIPLHVARDTTITRDSVEAAHKAWREVTATAEDVSSLAAASLALGIGSARALLQALRLARIAAAIEGRSTLAPADLEAAARLVLAPRATCLPSSDPAPTDPPEPLPPESNSDDRQDDGRNVDSGALADIVVAAAATALPAWLVDGTASARRPSAASAAGRGGRSGAVKPDAARGRLLRPTTRRTSASPRLDVMATLKSAVPWQGLRARERGRTASTADAPVTVVFSRSDLRFQRRARRTQSTIVFAVDASGSCALHRLTEAKGAVELLLGRCYARRESVALITFRRDGAELMLPPTRSLSRARRALAGLPGGGGTPLAAGLATALDVARTCRQRGQRPFVVVLTDAKANIARSGKPDRGAARAEAATLARAIAAEGTDGVLIDTSPRPSPEARQLAADMGADYYPLPTGEAQAVHAAVRASRSARQPRTLNRAGR